MVTAGDSCSKGCETTFEASAAPVCRTAGVKKHKTCVLNAAPTRVAVVVVSSDATL